MSDGLLTWSELERLADSQEDRWVFEGLLRQGELVLFHGAPYSGKTTTTCELAVAAATGSPFLGFPVPEKHLILFVNADGAHERTLRNRFKRAVKPDGVDAWNRRFYSVATNAMKLPLDAEFLRLKIEAVQARFGAEERGIVVIDGLRTGLLVGEAANVENDSASMSRILRPIRNLARETGWVILVLHHSNRSSGDYSGSAAIPGATEGVWSIERHETSKTSTLRVKTRDAVLPALRVMEHEGGLQLAGNLNSASPDGDAVTNFVEQFPTDEAAGWTRDDVVDKGLATEKTVAKALQRGLEGGLVQTGRGRKGSPFRYHRRCVRVDGSTSA
ncbi:hypothetical protein Pan44_18040 [Caulifigura coniformis]|uniref:AAA+ ATPase domain-containing protein n=1 Tax=Caulifigura coniformis TaxID=2527983 RepID=A0A517SCB5_9PLAN|nr:AAA family ATPase [Caulifigura coniformis]QDT53780.1 hypothetical protein Pan44_18040 [Caulifigura coniformis]